MCKILRRLKIHLLKRKALDFQGLFFLTWRGEVEFHLETRMNKRYTHFKNVECP